MRSRNLKEPEEVTLTVEEFRDLEILIKSFEPTFEKTNLCENDFTRVSVFKMLTLDTDDLKIFFEVFKEHF